MPSIYQFRMTGSGWTGAPGYNIYNALAEGFGADSSRDDLEDFAEQLRAMYNSYAPYLVGVGTWQVDARVVEFEIGTATLIREHAITQPPPSGSSAGAGNSNLPRAAAINVKLTTDLTRNGRVVKGRSFIGPAAVQAFGADGWVVPGVKTLTPTAFGGLLDIAGPLRLAVWGKPLRPGHPADHVPVGVAGYVQTATAVDVPGTITRRKR